MIAASALILAATSCTLPGSERLGGRAVILRPVGTFETVPFERLGPTTSVRTSPVGIQQTTATRDEKEGANAGQPASQCEAVVIAIA